jgi:hypothetical protein
MIIKKSSEFIISSSEVEKYLKFAVTLKFKISLFFKNEFQLQIILQQ